MTKRPRGGPIARKVKSFVQSALLARLLRGYLAFCRRTTRWTILGAENLAPLLDRQEGFILAFWHECVPLMPMAWSAFWRQGLGAGAQRPARVLVSRSRDGRMISNLLGAFGLGTIEGSSSNGGRAAARTLVTAIRAGEVVVIVPDGPRGPRQGSAEGANRIACLTKAPIVPCAATTRHAFRIRSWDRMIVPLPFARCVASIGAPLMPLGVAADEPQLRAALIEALARSTAASGAPTV